MEEEEDEEEILFWGLQSTRGPTDLGLHPRWFSAPWPPERRIPGIQLFWGLFPPESSCSSLCLGLARTH